MDENSFWTKLQGLILTRVDNPFIFSTALSWCALNYPVFIVAFGDGDYQKKIQYIQNSLLWAPNQWQAWYPVLIGVAYTVLYPIVNLCVQWLHGHYEVLQKGIRISIAKSLILTPEDRDIAIREIDERISVENAAHAQVERSRKALYQEHGAFHNWGAALVGSALAPLSERAYGRKEEFLTVSASFEGMQPCLEQDLREMGIPKAWVRCLDVIKTRPAWERSELMQKAGSEGWPDANIIVDALAALGILHFRWAPGRCTLIPNLNLLHQFIGRG